MPAQPMTFDRFLDLLLKVCWVGVLVVLFLGLLGAINLHPL